MYLNNTKRFKKIVVFFLASTSSLHHHHKKVNQYTYYLWVCAVPIKTERKDIIQRNAFIVNLHTINIYRQIVYQNQLVTKVIRVRTAVFIS